MTDIQDATAAMELLCQQLTDALQSVPSGDAAFGAPGSDARAVRVLI